MGKSNQYRNLTQEEKNKIFIEKTQTLYGDKYDYSKVNFINSKTKVCIIYPKHGEFWVLPENFFKGHACKYCTIERISKKQDEFISDAYKVHGNKYNYDKVNYINSYTKVCVTCPIHGDFWIEPRDLLQGQGCRKCGFISMRDKQAVTTQQFIEKAKKCHTVDYDYSKVEYKHSDEPVCIICPKHGEFWMTPHQFLRGSNCPMCSCRHRLTKEEFIEKARNIHGNKYDYSKVNYINNMEPVCIICQKHGEFW